MFLKTIKGPEITYDQSFAENRFFTSEERYFSHTDQEM